MNHPVSQNKKSPLRERKTPEILGFAADRKKPTQADFALQQAIGKFPESNFFYLIPPSDSAVSQVQNSL